MNSDIQILTQIRAQLTDSKWAKASQTRDGNRLCLGMAIERAAHNTPGLDGERYVAVERLLGKVADVIKEQYHRLPVGGMRRPDSPVSTIINFNDHYATTLADVHAVLDATIAELKSEDE